MNDEYEVQATVTITAAIQIRDVDDRDAAAEEADGYFDNSANWQGRDSHFHNVCVTAVDIEDVNEA